jgi:la-related protein 1
MDSQGFVFLTVLTNFNRIRQLTSDIDLIRYVCRMSSSIDIQTGVDGHDRVRKAEGWEQWVLGIEEREPTARNETPVSMQQTYLPQLPTWDPSRTYTHTPMLSSSAMVSPRSSGPAGQTRVTSVSTHSVNGTASAGLPSASESIPNGYITNGHVSQTPLSAAVPDFTPGLQPLSNSTLAPLESSHAFPPNSFSDEQVENLKIVIRKPHSSPTSTRVPFPSAASRTFSNGSIDGSTLSAVISDLKDKRQASSANGDFTTER